MTRNGGGNRECDRNCDECWFEFPNCPPEANKRLAEHPLYIRDYDDDFDETYAHFEFRVPEDMLEITTKLYKLQGPQPTLKERFDKVMKEIENMSKEQLEKDPRFKDICKALKKILGEGNS